MSLGEIAAAVGGRVVDSSADLPVTAPAFLDSRHPVDGGLFVAVPGANVDGHEHAAEAVAQGAAAALVSRPVAAPAVLVDDPVVALGRLASAVLVRFPHLRVIGLTGSQGKTSTKDLLAQLLEPLGETVAPVGSFNNELGVPLTALRATASTRYLIVEMGAKHRGHIRHLCSIVRPSVGIVLNVGSAHIEKFGSRDQIAATKAELVEALPPHGLAVLNADDERVAAMRSHTRAGVVFFGESPAADVRLSRVSLDPAGRARFSLTAGALEVDIQTDLVGAHQATNAAAATTAALGLGRQLEGAAEVLQHIRPRSRWRMEVAVTPEGVTVVNDAYNANPDSMRSALQTLATLGSQAGAGRTFAVLGEMLELGPVSDGAHRDVGRLVTRLGIDRLVAVGAAGATIHAATQGAAWPGRSVHVDDPCAATEHLRRELRAGDLVLVKASRDVGLERVAQALLAERASA